MRIIIFLFLIASSALLAEFYHHEPTGMTFEISEELFLLDYEEADWMDGEVQDYYYVNFDKQSSSKSFFFHVHTTPHAVTVDEFIDDLLGYGKKEEYASGTFKGHDDSVWHYEVFPFSCKIIDDKVTYHHSCFLVTDNVIFEFSVIADTEEEIESSLAYLRCLVQNVRFE